MGIINSNNPHLNNFLLIVNKVFEIYKKKKILKVSSEETNRNSSLTFLNKRFQCTQLQEKHFVNVYRVYDHDENIYKNMKIIPIINTNEVKEIFTKDLTQFINLSNNTNPGLIKIVNFYYDESSNNRNKLNLIILEEDEDFITFKDFLTILFEEKELLKLHNIDLEKDTKLGLWKNGLIKVFIFAVEIIDYLHKHQIFNVNLNILNVIICREEIKYTKSNNDNLKHEYEYQYKFNLKFSDVEIPHIIKTVLMKNKSSQGNQIEHKNTLNHIYFDTLNLSDSQNLLIFLMQIVYSFSTKKINNNFFFNIHKFTSMALTSNLNKLLHNSEFFKFFLEKILHNIIINHCDPLFKEDYEVLIFFKELINADEKIINKFQEKLKSLLERENNIKELNNIRNLQENKSEVEIVLKTKKSSKSYKSLSKSFKSSQSFYNSNKPGLIKLQNYLKIIFLVLENESEMKFANVTENEIINLCFILLDYIKINAKEELEIFFKSNQKKSMPFLYLLIQKYITFIQTYYPILKIDLIEIFNIILDSTMNNYIHLNPYANTYTYSLESFNNHSMLSSELDNTHRQTYQNIEEINKIKSAGLFPLVLSYINNCEIDIVNFFEFIEKVTKNSSLTIVTLLEKINFDLYQISIGENYMNTSNPNDYDKYSNSNSSLRDKSSNIRTVRNSVPAQLKLKSVLFRLLPKFNLNALWANKDFYHKDDILTILKNYPLIRRRKANLIEQINFLISLFEENFINMKINTPILEIEEKTYINLLDTLLSALLYKQSIRSAFLYSTCTSAAIQNILSSDTNYAFFSEFGALCLVCKMNICLICLHRCHVDHTFISLGYSYFNCECRFTNTCVALNQLEVPGHVRKSYVYSVQGDHGNNLNTSLNNNLHLDDDKLEFEAEDEVVGGCQEILGGGPEIEFKPENRIKSENNLYISIEYETVTIQSKNPICQIIEVTRDQDIFLDFNEETLYYFEVEIILGGYYDQIAIGITSNEKFPKNEFAGYLENSIGYHADDGKCYVNSIGYSYGVKFGSYDIIGCGVTMNGNVYFTHNGCILPLLDIKLKGNIYSIISLRGKYSSIRVNHSNSTKHPFIFKHHKQKLYKPPNKFKDHSELVCKILNSNQNFINLIQNYFKKYKTNPEIVNKFRIFSEIIQPVTKFDKKNINLKKKNIIPVPGDIIEEVEDELKASPKIRPEQETLEGENKKIYKDDVNINLISTLPTPNNFIKNKNNNFISNQSLKSRESYENICKCGKESNCLII